MARLAGPIKDAIVGVLAGLKTAGKIGSYISDDLTPNPLTMDFPSYPCVVVGLPSQESDYETNRENLRTYEYPLMVIARQEDFAGDTKMFENFIDDISDAFDNDPTLGGAAVGAVAAAFTRPAPINNSTKDILVTFAIIRAKALVELTF